MPREVYIREFSSDKFGRILCSNAVDGSTIGLHTRKFAKDAISKAYVEATLQEGDSTSTREFICLISDFASAGAKCMAGRAKYGSNFSFGRGRVSTVLPLGALGVHASYRDLIRLKSEIGHDFVDLNNQNFISALTRLEPSKRYFRMRPGQKLGQKFVWITKRTDLKSIYCSGKSSKTGLADRCRDSLGLIHRVPPTVLMAIHIPAVVVEKAGHFRPTFLEAGDNRRFSAKARSDGIRVEDAWGHTIDLAYLDRLGKLGNGQHERICRPIDSTMFTKRQTISFDVLGMVTTINSTSDYDFSINLADGRTDGELSKFLGGDK